MHIRDTNPQCAYRIELKRTPVAAARENLASPSATARFCHDLASCDRERVVRLDLDVKCQLTGIETIAIGSVDSVPINPGEVFRGAIVNGASRIILVHNHPSGSPEPSEEDRSVADKLSEAGELLQIPLVDFVIIGDHGRYWSKIEGLRRIRLPDPGQRRLIG